MTMKHTAGDLTTLWVGADEDGSDEDAAAVRADTEAADPVAARETDSDIETDGDAPDVEGAAATNRSAKAERRRAQRQYAQQQRRAREAVLQVLFEVDLVGHAVTEVRERQFDEMTLTDDARVFAERLIDGVLAERARLDALIATLAPTWPTDQLPRVDINIMRLALYELLVEPETPTGAVINEAVDLAKQYGSENSGKFVNGVLGTVATRIMSGEITRAAVLSELPELSGQ